MEKWERLGSAKIKGVRFCQQENVEGGEGGREEGIN